MEDAIKIIPDVIPKTFDQIVKGIKVKEEDQPKKPKTLPAKEDPNLFTLYQDTITS